MAEKASLAFQKPDFTYEELELQLQDYEQNPEGYKHDEASVISIKEAIRAGRIGNIAVGGCLLHHGEVIAKNGNKTIAPYHRTDLHAEMVLLNDLEDSLKDNPTPEMRNYTLFSSQEPCPMCLARICFNQVGKTYYVYRDGSSPEAGEQSNWDRLPPGFRGLGSRLIVEEADCSPKLKEISKQVWMNSIESGINEYLDRY
jgi:tRNA(Arg) A34 adenosine deaminase TadA